MKKLIAFAAALSLAFPAFAQQNDRPGLSHRLATLEQGGYLRFTTTVTAAEMIDTVAHPVALTDAPGADYYYIPYRVLAHKAAGTGYVVGSNDLNFGYYFGGNKFSLTFLECSPATVGSYACFDSNLETACAANGPSFSWTGAAEFQSALTNHGATATITYTVSDVTAGKIVNVNGTNYTFVAVVAANYDVKVDGTSDGSWTNLKDAIDLTAAPGVGNNQAGGKYMAPAAHTTASAAINTGTNVVTLTASTLNTTGAGTNAFTLSDDEATSTIVSFAGGYITDYRNQPIYVWSGPTDFTTGTATITFTVYVQKIPLQ